MRTVLWLLLGTTVVSAQPFTVGIKAGVPLTDFINGYENQTATQFSSENHHYLIGGTAEVRLPLGLAVELDALYRRIGYLAVSGVTFGATANAWEFPLLLTYRFHSRIARPFIDGGIAWDTLTGLKQTVSEVIPSGPGIITVDSPTSPPSEVKNATTTGVVFGAAVDIHAVFLHISPEVRYTRWISPHVTSEYGMVNSSQHQAEIMVGFTF